MTPQVTVYVGTRHDLVHTSLLHTGLAALASRGAITLAYRRPGGADEWLAADPMVVCVDVGQRLRIAIDLRDGEGVSEPIIDRVQCYLKRAYSADEANRLPEAYARILQPFGLNYGCRSAASTARVLSTLGWPLIAEGRNGWQRIRQYLLTPGPQVFEQGPDTAAEPLIAFQTRLWLPGEIAPGEAEVLNPDRIAIVRALRAAFGQQFVGGLVPTRYALEHFPDDVTPHSSKYAEYLAIKKRCLVSVYTRGVEHSLAFKLGETFAASQCLVSVPLKYQLPRPLEEGRNYLLFNTPDECVAACRRLLDDAALARSMREANHRFYQDEVEPAAHVQRVLSRVGTSAL
jgi:hypothetical protein